MVISLPIGRNGPVWRKYRIYRCWPIIGESRRHSVFNLESSPRRMYFSRRSKPGRDKGNPWACDAEGNGNRPDAGWQYIGDKKRGDSLRFRNRRARMDPEAYLILIVILIGDGLWPS